MNITDEEEYTGFTFKDAAYEYRLVAFVDLLGFVKYLEERDLKNVLDVLETFHKDMSKESFHERFAKSKYAVQNDDFKVIDPVRLQDRRVTVFSDLVVISYRGTKEYLEWNFKELIDTIHEAQNMILSKGVLLRGGITYEKLYHNERYCVGPGLVRAYYLESKVANFPRIIIDPEISRKSPFNKFCSDHINLHEQDGIWATNEFEAIKQLVEVNEQDLKSPELHEFRANMYIKLKSLNEIIENGIASGVDKVVEKMSWMVPQYNEALVKVTSTLGNDFSIVDPKGEDEFYKTLLAVKKIEI